MSLESWIWKLEPCSPLADHDSQCDWSLQECDLEEPTTTEEAPAVVPSRADLAQQLLDDIEEYVKKEETFSDWFEEKVHIPIFDDIQPLPMETPAAAVPVTTTLPALPTLQSLVIKNNVDMAFVLGQGHLTPPQSPPAVDSLYMVSEPTYMTLQPSPTEYILTATTPDLAHEMAVVDEVVRGAAQQWEQWESTDSNSRSSDSTEDSDDPEWSPNDKAVAVTVTGRRARQQRPYNLADRRMRKKEQNKNAATRYRQKKKAEVSGIVQEERTLDEQNSTLHAKLSDLQREVTYLKGLMRDVFRAKGLIK